jgi:nitroreductase
MEVYEAIVKRRSIRRFKSKPVGTDVLEKLVNAARIAPSSANLQPLEYILVYEEKVLSEVFSCLKWAGYVTPRRNPPVGKRPTAYVVVLVNTAISKSAQRDVGAAVENLILAAVEEGIGSCWLGAINRRKLREILRVPSQYRIDSVVALGYPDEAPLMEEATNSIKYYLDSNDRLHVPKRSLKKILHWNQF